jgi:hypothetical protein
MVILTVATSQLDKATKRIELRGFAYETLVDFSANDYRHFKQPTAIDCNEAWPTNMSTLARLHAEGKLRAVTNSRITPAHMARIEAGILMSTRVVPEIKAIVRTAEHPA